VYCNQQPAAGGNWVQQFTTSKGKGLAATATQPRVRPRVVSGVWLPFLLFLLPTVSGVLAAFWVFFVLWRLAFGKRMARGLAKPKAAGARRGIGWCSAWDRQAVLLHLTPYFNNWPLAGTNVAHLPS
jgi:hypothetical protein